MSFDEIKENFELLDDWEDRYRYVIELGRALPELDEASRTETTKVRGCASQVWLVTRLQHEPDGTTRMRFEGDSDAHIVRGLIAVLIALYDGLPPAQACQLDAHAAFAELGLKDHLTPQRSNGLASMIQRIHSDAASAAAGA